MKATEIYNSNFDNMCLLLVGFLDLLQKIKGSSTSSNFVPAAGFQTIRQCRRPCHNKKLSSVGRAYTASLSISPSFSPNAN